MSRCITAEASVPRRRHSILSSRYTLSSIMDVTFRPPATSRSGIRLSPDMYSSNSGEPLNQSVPNGWRIDSNLFRMALSSARVPGMTPITCNGRPHFWRPCCLSVPALACGAMVWPTLKISRSSVQAKYMKPGAPTTLGCIYASASLAIRGSFRIGGTVLASSGDRLSHRLSSFACWHLAELSAWIFRHPSAGVCSVGR